MTNLALEGADVLHTGPVTIEGQPAVATPGRLSGISRRISALRQVPNIGTWFGIGLSLIGVVLLVVAWGKTAGLTNVALQIPYLISAGFTGLGLVVAGLTVVNLEAKRADAADRAAQVAELRGLLRDLREVIEDDVR